MRAGRVNFKDSFAIVENGELYIHGMHISPYEQGNIFNVDPLRPRKLLMHKKEIMRLLGKTREQGLTLVPLKAYFKKDKIKIELALAKGKKLYDKRDAAAEKTAKREIEKAAEKAGREAEKQEKEEREAAEKAKENMASTEVNDGRNE